MANMLNSFKKTGKIIGLGFILVTGLFMAIFVGQEARRYLVKASSCPAGSVRAAQVTGNSAVISWETTEETQGRIEYGTSATNLAFSAPEGTSGKTHNVPLTLLTPNTLYYYLVVIGNNKCDSTGKSCTGSTCVPFTFTTTAVDFGKELVNKLPSVTPTKVATPTAKPTIKTASPSANPQTTIAQPTSSLSAFCLKVSENLGKTNQATNWANIKQYDIDANNRINSVDIIKCKQSGK